MQERNPFAINFGIIPNQYIQRDFLTDEISMELESDVIQNQCYMLTGIRGSGKTVTLTAIERIFNEKENWIVIGLNSERDMLQSLVAKLYDTNAFINEFVSVNLNLSKFGIGLNLENQPPIADIESALEKILREIKKKNKRLLVTIDEVSSSAYMKQFASTFQLLIRAELPIFVIMAGLYENIHNLENQDNLTFLYRTPKYDMEPLNISIIRQRYMNTFQIDSELAMEMALATKGYAFAYQVIGKYVWESASKQLDDDVLINVDAALSRFVYEKIWSELSKTDKWYLSFIVQKDSMETNELLKLTKKKKNEFSQYRVRLRDKGIIDVSSHGVIKMKLPRFEVFVKNMLAIEGIILE